MIVVLSVTDLMTASPEFAMVIARMEDAEELVVVLSVRTTMTVNHTPLPVKPADLESALRTVSVVLIA